MACDLLGSYSITGEAYRIEDGTDTFRAIGGTAITIRKVGKDFFRYEETELVVPPVIGAGTTSPTDPNTLVFSAETQFGHQLIYVTAAECKRGKAQKILVKKFLTTQVGGVILISGTRNEEKQIRICGKCHIKILL